MFRGGKKVNKNACNGCLNSFNASRTGSSPNQLQPARNKSAAFPPCPMPGLLRVHHQDLVMDVQVQSVLLVVVVRVPLSEWLEFFLFFFGGGSSHLFLWGNPFCKDTPSTPTSCRTGHNPCPSHDSFLGGDSPGTSKLAPNGALESNTQTKKGEVTGVLFFLPGWFFA